MLRSKLNWIQSVWFWYFLRLWSMIFTVNNNSIKHLFTNIYWDIHHVRQYSPIENENRLSGTFYTITSTNSVRTKAHKIKKNYQKSSSYTHFSSPSPHKIKYSQQFEREKIDFHLNTRVGLGGCTIIIIIMMTTRSSNCDRWCLFAEIELQQIRRPDQEVVPGAARAIGGRQQGTAATKFRKFFERMASIKNYL